MGFIAEAFYQLIVIGRTMCPRGTFTVGQIPDMTGRIAIVTGGNSGIGKETVKALLQHNAKVYLAGRSKEKADAVIAKFNDEIGKEALFLELDLGSLSSVKKAAENFLSQEKELHILFNNAGIMACPVELTTTEGYDMQFGTNVIGHFLLTELLMPALLAGKETSPDKYARVITTSSSTAMFETISWDTLKDGPARRKKRTHNLYSQSKFVSQGNVVVARQITKRYGQNGILSLSVDPGSINTNLARYVREKRGLEGAMINLVLWMVTRPTPFGALTQLWAGTSPEALQRNGEYLVPTARVAKCRPEAYDDELGERLWQWLKEEVKAYM